MPKLSLIDEHHPLLHQHIISLLNLEYLPDSQKAILLDKMVEVINQRVFLRVLEDLEEENRKQLEDLLDKGNDDELQKFIAVHVPDFLIMLGEETIVLKEEMMKKVKEEDGED